MKRIWRTNFLLNLCFEDLAYCIVPVVVLIIEMIRNLGLFSLQNQKWQNVFCLLSLTQYSK